MQQKSILWLKVFSIAAVQGAITLTWVIYKMYFPALLVEFGFERGLATTILILENAIEAAIEPIFGSLSDQQQQHFSIRLPIISLGIILASILFISIPTLVILGKSTQVWRWLLPGLAVVWATAMAIFRSPAIALLGRCANNQQLPQAASIVTLVGAVVGALRFDVYGIILKLGAGFAFTIGSIALLLAAVSLRWFHPPVSPSLEINNRKPPSLLNLGLIFTTGIFVGWGLRFLMPTIKQVITLQFGEDNSKLGMMLFFLILGLAAIPTGKLATKLGNYSGMLIGLAFTISLSLLVLHPNQVLVRIFLCILVIGLSFVFNGTVPFALSLVPQQYSGLAVGMYFGGFSGGISFFDFIFSQLGNITIKIGVLGSIVSFILVAICIFSGKKIATNY